MAEFNPALTHGPVTEIGPDLFCVRGVIRLNRFATISRNMVIVRQGQSLTLINTVRMNAKGLAQLDALGRVEHVLRLGGMHGSDDPFYVERYKPKFWAQPGSRAYPEPPIDHPLTDLGELPFDGAALYLFRGAQVPEAAIVLARGPGVLLTCDALQHYGDYSRNNLMARLVMPFIGFPRRTVVGPIWLRVATPEGGSLRPDFERLMTAQYDALFAAHGTFLASGAAASVRRAVDLAFPTPS